MSPQDSQMLTDFLNQLIQVRGIQKDPEADAQIQRAVAQQPDAAYLLVQRALLLEQGLNNARAQISALQNQLQGQQGNGKFLDANTWGNSGTRQAPAQVQPPAQQYQPAPSQAYQPQYQPPYQPSYQQTGPGSMGTGGLGGFLRGGMLGSIATTAAGVVAGDFLFQGLENMFSHREHGSNHLLDGGDQSNSLFNDQSGSSLADQAGLGSVDQSVGQSSQGLFDSNADSGADTGSLDSDGQGFFDGDGSDEGLFS